MKKTIFTLIAAISICSVTKAQSAEDGIKFIYYEKFKSAVDVLQKAVAANPSDATAAYWLGQAYLQQNPKDIVDAKKVYQDALQRIPNNPYLLIGMGHLEILETNNVNAARQKFEVAITSTKGKKGVENADILNAVGRAEADGGTTVGDPLYGIDVLSRAKAIDTKNPDIDINLGLCYLKLGTDHGAEAVSAFQDAVIRNPQYAKAYYRMGRIYQAQNNPTSMEDQFNKAVTADPNYGPAYLSWFQYYQDRDVNKAKEYLDKYVPLADKDCNNDFFMADYLFRAGKYQESLDKANAMDAGDCKGFSKINALYAYNYDRLGDSIQAKSYIDKFLSTASPEDISPDNYVFAAQEAMKFTSTDSADSAANVQINSLADAYLTKAFDLTTDVPAKTEIATKAASVMANAKIYDRQLYWLTKLVALKGKTSESDYYKLSKASLDAKAFIYLDSVSRAYVVAFPDKPQGYSFNVKAAMGLDEDSTKGLMVEPINTYNSFLMKDQETNKKAIFNNYYSLLIYYHDKAKDVAKAMEMCDNMIVLYPNPPGGEEYDFASATKKALQSELSHNKGSKGNKP